MKFRLKYVLSVLIIFVIILFVTEYFIMKMHLKRDSSDKPMAEIHPMEKLKQTHQVPAQGPESGISGGIRESGTPPTVHVEKPINSHLKAKKSFYVDETKPQHVPGKKAGPQRVSSPSVETTLPQKENTLPESSLQQPASIPSTPSSTHQIHSPRVHTFHYAWYEAPPIHKTFAHWNHRQLPHWTQAVNQKYPHINERYDPTQGEIGSVYYPQLGLYSSSDRVVIKQQFQWMKQAGIGTMVLSWWGREGKSDGEGQSTPLSMMQTFFEEATRYNMKIAFHLEPYDGRSEDSVREDIAFLIDNFGNEEALYRVDSKHLKYSTHESGTTVPVFYIYDSYHIPANNWARILNPTTENTIRNTEYDGVMLSLFISPGESEKLVLGGHFDGIYTYFASRTFTHGSNPNNWASLNSFCERNKLLFVPSIGPGYNDIRVRPWNSENIQPHANGDYYRQYFESVMKLTPQPAFLSITSWNEWHEGTNIEPARSYKSQNGYEYQTYPNNDPEFYLHMTGEFVNRFEGAQT